MNTIIPKIKKRYAAVSITAILVAGLFIGLSSCNLINPVEQIPAYIHLDSISLATINDGNRTEGSNSHGIYDAWVFVDNQYLGTYQLPCNFPVLAKGAHKIGIRGGIIVNGISQNRTAYPVYKTYDTTITFEEGKTVSFLPTLGYLSSATFPQIEDFEGGGFSLASTSASTTNITITGTGDPNAFEYHSAHVELDANHTLFEAASTNMYSLPTTVPVWMELNYKCDNEFTIGVIVNGSSGVIQSPLLNIRATSVWKKVYVNLSDLGGIIGGAVQYKIYLRAVKSQYLTTANLYFDNLKVVY